MIRSARTKTNTLALLLAGLLATGAYLALSAGEMEPPGPPAPTMKPLNELEPRYPIYAADLPLTISQPGSYYLMENISTSGGGITVDADNVTIDLMGFTLRGGTGNGITGLATRIRTTVRNGRIANWDQHGLALSDRAVLLDVIAEDNAGNGIQVGGYSTVIDSAGDGNLGHGIVVQFESTVRGSRGTANGENGIWADYSLVLDSIANVNDKNGIRVDDGCYVRGCIAQSNDQNQWNNKAGIWVTGNDNRIEANHLLWNNIGMDIDGNDNVIVKNTIWKVQGGGSVYFDIDPGATGNLMEIATSPSTAGPWANFTP